MKKRHPEVTGILGDFKFRGQGQSRPIWAHLRLCGAYLALAVPIWLYINLSRPLWPYLGLSGPIWAYLGLSGFKPS